MSLRQIFTYFLRKKIEISKQYFTIILNIPPQAITPELLILLNKLLNDYNQIYFIIFKGIPPCVLPGAFRKIIYIRQDTRTYKHLDACSTCSLNKNCPGWCTDIPLSPQNNKPIENIPSEIAIEITGQCNLNCGYCTSATKNKKHLSFETVKKILDDAHHCRILDIRFTGGEPLLNPELPDMLAYAKSCGFYVMLNTNATLITPTLMPTLSRSINNVLISLQGFNETSDRMLTNSPLPFLKKIQNIFLLRSYIPIVRIGTVITPTLLDNWAQYAALIKKIRPYSWELFRPMNGEGYELTKEDYRKLTTALLTLNQEGISTKLANALPFCVLPDLLLSTSTMLGALYDDGNSKLIWDMRGFFKPSYFIHKNLGTDIAAAWTHSFLRKLKTNGYLPTECKECTYWSWCRGGSRVMACKTYNTYFAPDPLFDKKIARQAKNLI